MDCQPNHAWHSQNFRYLEGLLSLLYEGRLRSRRSQHRRLSFYFFLQDALPILPGLELLPAGFEKLLSSLAYPWALSRKISNNFQKACDSEGLSLDSAPIAPISSIRPSQTESLVMFPGYLWDDPPGQACASKTTRVPALGSVNILWMSLST